MQNFAKYLGNNGNYESDTKYGVIIVIFDSIFLRYETSSGKPLTKAKKFV